MFADRVDAGRQLAAALERYRAENPIVLALPRGGVPVGAQVARALGAPLDVLLVRKISAPGMPEFGIGAVVDGPEPQVVLNKKLVRLVAPPHGYIDAQVRIEMVELERQRVLYAGERKALSPEGRLLIVVDDGITTGSTIRAALRVLRHQRPKSLIVAVPVMPPKAVAPLRATIDKLICLLTPQDFEAVGQFYEDFTETPEEQVSDLLRSVNQQSAARSPISPPAPMFQNTNIRNHGCDWCG